jgi:hypothetical protein
MRKLKYYSMEDGERLDLGSALSQAAQLLDLSGQIALEARDVKTLMKLSDRWMEIAGLFAHAGEDEEVIDISESDPESYGFCMPNKEEVNNGGEDSDDGDS